MALYVFPLNKLTCIAVLSLLSLFVKRAVLAAFSVRLYTAHRPSLFPLQCCQCCRLRDVGLETVRAVRMFTVVIAL
jgi:hypothetical protein